MYLYHNNNTKRESLFLVYCLLLLLPFSFFSCKKLIEVVPPTTANTEATVYSTDATAAGVLTGIYTRISQQNSAVGGGPSIAALSLIGGVSSDELNFSNSISPNFLAYYRNQLASNIAGTEFWGDTYNKIFICNSALQGIESSISLTPSVKQQLLGEAKFLRGLFYFYLVNLYDSVPLVLTTDYKVSSVLPRASRSAIYEQIVLDVKDAQNLLSDNYLDGLVQTPTTKRVRPNRSTATALLSRVYLYMNDWANAEATASSVINNTARYQLQSDLNKVFLADNPEAIWQLPPVQTGRNTNDALIFIVPSTGPGTGYPTLSTQFLSSFENGDARRIEWVDSVIVLGNVYYYPFKYKVNDPAASVTEYQMILRLSEQFLIRAEARAQQNSLIDAAADLDAIRVRANLPGIVYSSQADLLNAIQHERQIELFTEMGHRWFDLKRTNTIDAVMNAVTPLKSNGQPWNSYQQWFPIPLESLTADPNLTQNQGY